MSSELRTQEAILTIQESQLRTQNSGLRTQDSELKTQKRKVFYVRGFSVTCNVRDADQDGVVAAYPNVSIAGLACL